MAFRTWTDIEQKRERRLVWKDRIAWDLERRAIPYCYDDLHEAMHRYGWRVQSSGWGALTIDVQGKVVGRGGDCVKAIVNAMRYSGKHY